MGFFSMRFAGKSAVLAEFSASTAENSKRLVNFCTPKARFFVKVSGFILRQMGFFVGRGFPFSWETRTFAKPWEDRKVVPVLLKILSSI